MNREEGAEGAELMRLIETRISEHLGVDERLLLGTGEGPQWVDVTDMVGKLAATIDRLEPRVNFPINGDPEHVNRRGFRMADRQVGLNMGIEASRGVPSHYVTTADVLSADERSKLAAYARKWIAIGNDTRPTARPVAEEWFRQVYSAVGLEPPRQIVWHDSPIQGAQAVRHLAVKNGPYPTPRPLGRNPAVLTKVRMLKEGQGAELQRDRLGLYWRSRAYAAPARVTGEGWADARLGLHPWFVAASLPVLPSTSLSLSYAPAEVRLKAPRLDAMANLLSLHMMRSSLSWWRVAQAVWSPLQGVDIDSWSLTRPFVEAMAHMVAYGQHEALQLCLLDYLVHECGLSEVAELVGALTNLAHEVGWWWALGDLGERIVACEKHRVVAYDGSNLLHREDGPAIEYADGWGVYAWHDLVVPRDVVMSPEHLTVRRIDNEDNVEVRRVMLECYGMARYLREGGAREVHRDDYGVLYMRGHRQVEVDRHVSDISLTQWRTARVVAEPEMYVVVRNSTPEGAYRPTGRLVCMQDAQGNVVLDGGEPVVVPEREFVPIMGPDGEPIYREYVLRVPPHVRTAREAVAWTFGESAEGYAPQHES